MVGELEIIFGVHPIARHLRITREVAIFFEQLRRIAAGAVVDPVAGISIAAIATTAAILAGVIVPAATATGLTIVDQRFVPMLSTKTSAPSP
ncbi:hypothetical protein FHS91_001287 [Sphingobium xanthum]